jgi:TPP-dependent pyruvate/acetoin dehydrogenase alpha subunit
VDGNDALAVRDAVAAAVVRARTGGGPSFVEALTYRLRGHYEGDPGKYRELSELADWKAKDPILRFVAAAGLETETAAAEAVARATVEAATDAALAAPAPSAEDLHTHVTAPVAA